MARYGGLLLAPAEGFGLRPRLFLPGKKRAYYAVLAHFWQFLVSSSNLGNRFSDFLTIFDNFWILEVFLWNFRIFLKFFGFFDFLDVFWILGFFEFC